MGSNRPPRCSARRPPAGTRSGCRSPKTTLSFSHVFGTGVHAGELLGIPATGNQVETEGLAVHRVRDGKIVEYWAVTDVARVLQQVGALPGPPG